MPSYRSEHKKQKLTVTVHCTSAGTYYHLTIATDQCLTPHKTQLNIQIYSQILRRRFCEQSVFPELISESLSTNYRLILPWSLDWITREEILWIPKFKLCFHQGECPRTPNSQYQSHSNRGNNNCSYNINFATKIALKIVKIILNLFRGKCGRIIQSIFNSLSFTVIKLPVAEQRILVAFATVPIRWWSCFGISFIYCWQSYRRFGKILYSNALAILLMQSIIAPYGFITQ